MNTDHESWAWRAAGERAITAASSATAIGRTVGGFTETFPSSGFNE
jgi:hypothetical protein